ncbi:MAG: tRNA (N6-isopentenyl adenosine(37)-C2)-methylthiotransferase MiaB [Chloroflexi bacterium]|nr:tRNA (N6-isopentenyl adenosine(37)-C2)-methylthiotransferase MiaB [Chloroflexota bacterium]MCL5947230.1 tRNA (N6-isopentenyl adenosine(37)-C2)-methylthiotransferase MiaB [Chloroflexota bacterium]
MTTPSLRKPRYLIWTVGCQMNKADSERIETFLDRQGCVPARALEEADLVILNTCAVRRSAEEHTEGQLGQLAGFKKRASHLAVAMTGCMVMNDTTQMQRRYPMVDLFFNSLQPEALQQLVNRPLDQPVPMSFDPTPIEMGPEALSPALHQLRSHEVMRYVPVIYGCDEHCTYCIVPSRRGRERSRPVGEIVAHVEELVSEGAREVTLLGQIVDRYGHDLSGRPDLAYLLERLSLISGLERIRFLTSHPRYIDERLIDAMRDLPKVCEYMHLPVQHGDDAVLRRMGRPYKVADYEYLVDHIRARLPNCSVSTDVIVGFCGETDEQFSHLLSLLDRVRFDVVHVAAYSPRPDTPSQRHFADDVPGAVKKERLWRVEALQERIGREINETLVGTQQEILVEGREREGSSRWKGRTRTNKITFFSIQDTTGDNERMDYTGHLVYVQVVQASARALQGRAILPALVEA